MAYLFTIDGQTWTDEDYTLDEMCEVELSTRIKWPYMDPTTEFEARRAMIVCWYKRSMSAEDAAKKAGALTRRQMKVESAEDDRPEEYLEGLPVVDPKAAGAESTTT